MRFWIRNGIYGAAICLLLPWLLWRRFKTGRYRHGLRDKVFGPRQADVWKRDRRGGPSSRAETIPLAGEGRGERQPPNDWTPETIWLHGVSVGEIQLLAPLWKRLKADKPHARFVVSTTTESGMELVEKLMPDIDRFYFPLDFSWAVRQTLDAVRPSLIVLGELELWPNLIDGAHARKIPLIVVNARLSEASFRGYRRLNWMTRGMFAKLTHVAAQSQTYADRFTHCGCPAERVNVCGNLKFDNLAFDRQAPQVQQLRRIAGISEQDRVWVMGSTQSPEEEFACQAWQTLRSEFPDLKLIVVPRHPDRFERVHALLSQQPLRLLRRSDIDLSQETAGDQWDVLLVDTVGELRWWWGLAEVAIVGGSFGDRGGQNMLEPAAYGVDVAFGPNTSNFKDVAELLIDGRAVTRISELSAISEWVRSALRNPAQGQQRGERARRLIEEQQGALQRTVEVILEHLPAAEPQRHVA